MVSSYGGTWSYSYVGMPPPSTTTTLDLKRDDKPKSLFVRAYNQQGRVISKYNLGGFFSREKVLEYVFTSIIGDAAPVQKQKSVARASLGLLRELRCGQSARRDGRR